MTQAPSVFSWDIYHADQDGVRFGPCGATTDRRRAVRALGDALRTSPVGTCGVIRKITPDPIGTLTYEYGGTVARAWHDAASGCVMWSRGTLL
jgi:hypothetical protein